MVSVPIPAVLPFDGQPRAMTDEELAKFRRRLGHPVCRSNGRYWTRYRLGFWTPVERIVPVSERDLRWPSARAVGIRAVVDDARSANTSFREGFIEDLPSYGVDRLNRNRRRSIRWALDHFEFRGLGSPNPLLEQGWLVASQGVRSPNHVIERSEMKYRQIVSVLCDPSSAAYAIGAFRGDELAAYMTTLAAGRVAYLNRLYISPKFRRDDVGSGLYWIALLMWARVPGVCRAALGGSGPGMESVDAYKRTIGVEFEDLPGLIRARPALSPIYRRLRSR